MSSELDALVYSNIKNNITDPDHLLEIGRAIEAGGVLDDINNAINEGLSETTIKRACCLGRQGVDKIGVPVRIFKSESTQSADPLHNKYHYTDKYVKVPESMCAQYPDYFPDSDQCNA